MPLRFALKGTQTLHKTHRERQTAQQPRFILWAGGKTIPISHESRGAADVSASSRRRRDGASDASADMEIFPPRRRWTEHVRTVQKIQLSHFFTLDDINPIDHS